MLLGFVIQFPNPCRLPKDTRRNRMEFLIPLSSRPRTIQSFWWQPSAFHHWAWRPGRFKTKFKITCWICPGSDCIHFKFSSWMKVKSMEASIKRFSILAISELSSFRLISWGWDTSFFPKANSCLVNSVPRWTAF